MESAGSNSPQKKCVGTTCATTLEQGRRPRMKRVGGSWGRGLENHFIVTERKSSRDLPWLACNRFLSARPTGGSEGLRRESAIHKNERNMRTKVAVRKKTKKTVGNKLASPKIKVRARDRASRQSGNGVANGHALTNAPSKLEGMPHLLPPASPVPAIVEANVDVGFGNTLFIRGEGPGLSWEHGTPMRCAGASTWEWSSDQVQGIFLPGLAK